MAGSISRALLGREAAVYLWGILGIVPHSQRVELVEIKAAMLFRVL
jgi:hypothetical protein